MKRLLVLLLVAAAALVVPASASAGVVVGIADQKPDMFLDSRFADLKIRQARLNVAWDALRSRWQRQELDRWLFLAKLNRVDPLISFGHSRIKRRSLPTPARMRKEFKAFRKRYPWVKTFATWNEANHCGEPVCNKPRLVARYWRELRLACPSCRVLAAELLDQPNMADYARRFRRAAGVEPKWWGVHNYVEVNRFRTTRLRQLLDQVKGQVWLTEVGGIVKRRTKKRYTVKRIPESKAHANRVTRYLFDEVLPISGRITRVYVYHWNSSTNKDSWDSALIGADNKRRPAYATLKKKIKELRDASRRRRR